MCKICELKPVYEFTNKRKLCKNCFIRYFRKKVLYTIRKFSMIKPDDVIGYETERDFRSVVLKDVLEMFAEKSPIELVKLPFSPDLEIAYTNKLKINKKQLIKNSYINNIKKFRANRDKLPNKIAINSNLDLEAAKIINTLIYGKVNHLKEFSPVVKKGNQIIIKLLYLFLDKEVLLYAKLRNLKFIRIKKENENIISEFINNLEKNHSEVKRAVINSYLKLMK